MQHQPGNVQANTMTERIIVLTVRHDPSLFPDEGALVSAIKSALFTKSAWFRNDQPNVTTIDVAEVMRVDAKCKHCGRDIELVDDDINLWSDDRGIDCEYNNSHEPEES